MPDEFVPESTKYFGASMRHVSRRDREKVHGAAVLAVMARTVRHILAYPFRVSVDLLLIFAGSMLGLVGPIFYSQMFMDNVLLHNSVDSARYSNLPQAKVVYWLTLPWHRSGPDVLLLVVLIGMGSLALIGVARGLFYTWWDINLKNRIVHRLRTTLMGRFLRLSLRFHTSQRVGDIIFRVQNDSDSIRGFYQQAVIEPWTEALNLVTRLGSMIALNWVLTLVAFSVFPFVLTLNLAMIMPVRRAARRAREANSDLMSKIEGTFGAIKAVVAFGREGEENAHYRDLSWNALSWNLRQEMWRAVLMQSVTQTLSFGRYALIFFGAYAVWNGWLTIGQWGVLNSYFFAVQTPVTRLTRTWTMLQTLLVGMDRVFTSMDLVPEIVDRPGAKPLPKVREGVEFRNVTVEYERGRPVLRNVSLTARIGEVTALVGTVGSGKSTLVSCIPRFIDPVDGQVLIDGVDVREYSLKTLRENVGVALQENQLFATTILENILYGSRDGYRGSGAWSARGRPRPESPGRGAERPDPRVLVPGALRLEDLDEPLKKELIEATRAACLDGFIAGLPRRFNTQVGEHASRVSGGEKQRIAVARAFIRKTPILILDEPTASLDAETEARLLHNLREFGKDRVIFIVAHRLATVRQANRICFMKDGEILETGPHDELVKIEGGHYRNFYEMQYHLKEYRARDREADYDFSTPALVDEEEEQGGEGDFGGPGMGEGRHGHWHHHDHGGGGFGGGGGGGGGWGP